MDDLSDEENEIEDIVRAHQPHILQRQPTHSQNMGIHNRGYNFLIPIGRTLTQQEEKNDVRWKSS
jgi:hypothetical protein